MIIEKLLKKDDIIDINTNSDINLEQEEPNTNTNTNTNIKINKKMRDEIKNKKSDEKLKISLIDDVKGKIKSINLKTIYSKQV